MQTEIVFSPSQRSCNLCFVFEHKYDPLVGMDSDMVDKFHADGKAQQARAA